MHRKLYLDPEKLEDRHLRHYAHAIGLDVQRSDHEMANHTYARSSIEELLRQHEIAGSPAHPLLSSMACFTRRQELTDYGRQDKTKYLDQRYVCDTPYS